MSEKGPRSPMIRTAHIGNVAQNAYLVAKFLRRLGHAADSFDGGGGQSPMWAPWWEETDFDPQILANQHFDWLAIARQTGWMRPAWAKILGNDAGEPWYDTQAQFQADLARYVPGITEGKPGVSPQQERFAIREVLSRGRLTQDEQELCVEGLRGTPAWRSMIELAHHYDLLVLYGPWASYAPVLPKHVPYITFEHGTMRQVMQVNTPDLHLMAAAYRHADANILTNADCGEAAACLGLSGVQRTFIPHPLDEERFSPGEDARSREARALIAQKVPGAGFTVFAPARQASNLAFGSKRNDRIFYAAARYVHEAEPAGAPKLALLIARWGDADDIRAAEKLCGRLGLEGRALWVPCVPKPRVRALYAAADVVVDQFSESIGSFGTVTAEALAVGRPVVTYLRASAHEWCQTLDGLGPELPPVCNALTADDLYEWLRRLARLPEEREAIGKRGRAWIEQWHGWERTTRLHLALYAQVLGVPVGTLVDAAASSAATVTTPDAAPRPLSPGRRQELPVSPTPAPQIHWTDAGPVGTAAAAVADFQGVPV